MEAVRTSETSVNFNVTTRRYVPEDSKLQQDKYLYQASKHIQCQEKVTNLQKQA
jgi:hypothetical protein